MRILIIDVCGHIVTGKQDGDAALIALAEKLVMASQEKEEDEMWLP